MYRHSNGGVFLSQRTYLEEVLLRLVRRQLNRANTIAAKPAARCRSGGPPAHCRLPLLFPRRRLPHVNHALAIAATFSVPWTFCAAHAPDNSRWTAIIRVRAYIKGRLNFGLKLRPDNSPLADFKAYSDSD